jgi:hypothetical protein
VYVRGRRLNAERPGAAWAWSMAEIVCHSSLQTDREGSIMAP